MLKRGHKARRPRERRNTGPTIPYGENLYWTSGTAAPGDVVGAWVAEVQSYNYAANSCTAVCGHYTQVVWKTTTQVGCGLATSAQGQYWVCNYNPPGNYEG